MSQQLIDQSVNGIRMRVCVAGEGPPVLLVHGFPLSHRMWQAQIDHLQQQYTVIAPDLRGFGGSGVTVGTVSMEQHARDLSELLDHLEIKEPVILGGLSMGGYIAWEFWKHFPEKLKALILCDTRADADSEEGVNNRLKMVELVLRHGPQAVASAMIPNLLSVTSREQSPEIGQNLIAEIESTEAEGIAASQRGMAERSDFSGMLERIEVPALLVVGSEDILTPPAVMQAVSAQMPQASCFEVSQVGHMAPLEAPGQVNQAIEKFLASC
ncbi:alpha/beta fold hydrolase [Gimesia panareensis]|uniref:3-oxoadipate enol-lactonase 2 n=1 Tax=Gimesia panareensis TaxID=2527978 RepID=A0A517QFM0_9PLAN|nr:alpha/beta hydrolase [Gimesia panareensis]QDT30438.1 3-oxoadipate enol-lactonase 2 [Gimesia panareensis]QDU53499.1 3-oxoadipate enol-lactonase 2 [Gimesia panareensis]